MFDRSKKINIFALACLAASLFPAGGCLYAGKDQGGPPPVEYTGTNQYPAKQQQAVVNGSIQYKNHQGEEILLEARHSVPCVYGRCPVIGEAPVATLALPAPGPFSLSLTQSPKDLMLIASCRSAAGSTRIAHVWLNRDEPVLTEVKLSLDRPYPPLR